MKFFKLKFIPVFLITIMLFGGFVAPVQAGLFDSGVETGLEMINWVLSWIFDVEATLLGMSGELIDHLLQPTPILTNPEAPEQLTMVQKGWTITRDFANMFFILILLAIALSFILFPQYGLKKALPKLLIIALLINFSLPIAGVFIDAANILTSFFVNSSSVGATTLSEALADNFKIHKVYSLAIEQYGNSPVSAMDLAQQTFKSLLFGIMFLGVMLFIFVALSIMFLFRIGWLYILLILLPLALVASILPAGSKYFNQWSSKFIQWTFFAPIATFFIFLSVVSFDSILVGDVQTFAAAAADETGINILKDVYNYIVVFMLLMGSLVAANSMGIAMAGTAQNMIYKAGRAVRSGAWSGTKRVASYEYKHKNKETGEETNIGLAQGLARASKFVGKIPLAGRILSPAVKGMAATSSGLRGTRKSSSQISESEKKAIVSGSAAAQTGIILGQPPLSHKMIGAAVAAAEDGLNLETALGKDKVIALIERAEKIGDTHSAKILKAHSPLAAKSLAEQRNGQMNAESLVKRYGLPAGTNQEDAREQGNEIEMASIYKNMTAKFFRKQWTHFSDEDKKTVLHNKIEKGLVTPTQFRTMVQEQPQLQTLASQMANNELPGFEITKNGPILNYLKRSAGGAVGDRPGGSEGGSDEEEAERRADAEESDRVA